MSVRLRIRGRSRRHGYPDITRESRDRSFQLGACHKRMLLPRRELQMKCRKVEDYGTASTATERDGAHTLKITSFIQSTLSNFLGVFASAKARKGSMTLFLIFARNGILLNSFLPRFVCIQPFSSGPGVRAISSACVLLSQTKVFPTPSCTKSSRSLSKAPRVSSLCPPPIIDT